MIPSQIGETAGSRKPKGAKWKSLDLVGVGVLTGINLSAYFSLCRLRTLIVSFILLIFAVTSGSTDGWKSPVVLILLIISIIMIAGFFYWETLLPADRAAMYVNGNLSINHRLILYQTTTDMVLQQLLCSVRHCTFAILLVEWWLYLFLVSCGKPCFIGQ
jgi:hypothetical protein